MSAIGDYIHRSSENYILYGTKRRGEGKNSWVDSYNAQLRKNKERLDRLSINNKELNEKLKQLSQLIQNESQKEEKSAQKQNDKNFEDNLQTVAERFQEYLINEIPTSLIYKRAVSSTKVNINNVNLEKAAAARRRIYENIDRINKMAGKSIPQNSLDTLIKNFNDFFNSLGMQNFSDVYKKTITSKNTIAQLRQLVQGFSLYSFDKATKNGQFGEQLVRDCGEKMQQLANENISSIIKGMEGTSFQLDKNLISEGVQKSFYQVSDGYNLYTSRWSQDKVDVEIKFNNLNIEASVKAYTPKGNIITAHLQDINLIYALAATENEFANHWLNMHSLVDYNSADREKMDEVFEEALRYEALSSGNLLKKDSQSANVFIVIDVKQGRVYSKTIYDILSNDKKNFILNPLISNISLTKYNRTQPTIEDRIANILMGLHQQKVSVMYKANLKNS